MIPAYGLVALAVLLSPLAWAGRVVYWALRVLRIILGVLMLLVFDISNYPHRLIDEAKKRVAELVVVLVVALGFAACGVEKPGGDLDAGADAGGVEVGAGGAGGAAAIPGCRGETYAREACGVVFEAGPAWHCNPLPYGGPCLLNDGRICVAVCP